MNSHTNLIASLQKKRILKFISVRTVFQSGQSNPHSSTFTDKLPELFSTVTWQSLQPDGFANDSCKVFKSESTVTHDCHV